jgi:hypothetical protein
MAMFRQLESLRLTVSSDLAEAVTSQSWVTKQTAGTTKHRMAEEAM